MDCQHAASNFTHCVVASHRKLICLHRRSARFDASNLARELPGQQEFLGRVVGCLKKCCELLDRIPPRQIFFIPHECRIIGTLYDTLLCIFLE